MSIKNLAVIGLLFVHPALAEDHTASWFQYHPREMNAQLDACRDDPGHASHTPNCVNAEQGQLLRGAADARAHMQVMNEVDRQKQERFWRDNPQALLTRLHVCNASPTAAVRAVWDCGTAYMSAQSVIQDLKRR